MNEEAWGLEREKHKPNITTSRHYWKDPFGSAIKKSAVWETVLNTPFLDEIRRNSFWPLKVINAHLSFQGTLFS